MNNNQNLTEQDHYWMKEALIRANRAYEQGEVPVGAILLSENGNAAGGHNQPILKCDPTAHAEIQVIRRVGMKTQNYRLVNTTLYVTLEPCAMCAAAMIHARVSRVVFGAYDPKAGAMGSCLNIPETLSHLHKMDVTGGVLADQCSAVLLDFFKERRAGNLAHVELE